MNQMQVRLNFSKVRNEDQTIRFCFKILPKTLKVKYHVMFICTSHRDVNSYMKNVRNKNSKFMLLKDRFQNGI